MPKSYVITDGSYVVIHKTAATDPQTVLEEAGLALDADDAYAVRSAEGICRIDIRRRKTLTLTYNGETREVVSRAETVAQLLERLDLPWSDADLLSHSPETRTCEGMELTVTCVVREKQTYTAVVPHETVYCQDGTLPEGTQKVVTEGVDGEALCEAVVTYINREETERELVRRQVITQPVSEIIAVGSAAEDRGTETAGQLAQIGENTITLPTGEVLTYTQKLTCLATAYHCEGYVGTTATGTRARVGAIAVDPEVFPYGTRFYIVSQDGEYIYGVATAEDCGSKEFIHDTRLDLYFNTRRECIRFGARNCDVYVLG